MKLDILRFIIYMNILNDSDYELGVDKSVDHMIGAYLVVLDIFPKTHEDKI